MSHADRVRLSDDCRIQRTELGAVRHIISPCIGGNEASHGSSEPCPCDKAKQGWCKMLSDGNRIVQGCESLVLSQRRSHRSGQHGENFVVEGEDQER